MLANCKIFGRMFYCRILDDKVKDEDGNACVMVKILNGPYKGNTAYIQAEDIANDTVYSYVLQDSNETESIKVLIERKDNERYYLRAFNDEAIRFSVLKENFTFAKKSCVMDEINHDIRRTAV